MSLEYTHENLQMAVSAVKDGGLKILTASKTYGIPFGTLYRRVKGHVDSDRFNRGPRTALSEEVERGLKETILEFQKKGFGLTRKEVMELAAKTNAIQETSAFKSGQPSNRWFQRFMKRHDLSLRTPENLSDARLSMSTVSVRDEFFDTYSSLVAKLQVSGGQTQWTPLNMITLGRK